MNVTRTTNQNGTHRYEIDGAVQYKASKVLYTHVSTYTNGAVTFHKTQAAADRTKGYKHWTKSGVVAITDGDAAAPVPATPEGPHCAACGDATCTAADAHHTVTQFTTRPEHIPADQWDAMSTDEQAAMGAWEAKMGRTAPAAATTPTEPGVTTLLADLVRPGHTLVMKDGRRFRVTSVMTRVDPATRQLDPTRRSVRTRDRDGVTQVFTIRVGRQVRVAK